jgi:spore coat-associated protein N
MSSTQQHGDPAPRRELGTGRKLVLSAAALGASVAVAVTGTTAAFSASAGRGHSLSTGVPQLVLGATGGATNRLDVDAVNLSPGEPVYRAFDVTNSGTTRFTAFTLVSTVNPHSPLDTDTTNGLKVRLERCSTPWSESGSGASLAYTCSGTRTEVLASRPVAMTGQALGPMDAATPGATDHLLLTEMLSPTADNGFQGLSTALTFTINAA